MSYNLNSQTEYIDEFRISRHQAISFPVYTKDE